MRLIKFRGKRIDNGEWVYGDLSITEWCVCITWRRDWILKGTAVYPPSVSQFTGLFDKNGTAIYEGDILQRTLHPINSPSYIENYEVKTMDHYIYHGETNAHFCVKLWGYDCEVIGNVHDNPELLEVGK